MKKYTLPKRVVILLVILMLDHVMQASSNSFDPNQGSCRKLRTKKLAPPSPKAGPNIGFIPPENPPPIFSPPPPPLTHMLGRSHHLGIGVLPPP
ncbi:hypothetical protein CTI12_AA048240 [Artemisia annua]|uniref:Transmembrane protein n=1 Tax=Artemisia annua TaxID=35608 RepID=A0A2U1QC39_ARTAN|nr:hypothetical protein CTI12_AA048240 [Artemisia annua]